MQLEINQKIFILQKRFFQQTSDLAIFKLIHKNNLENAVIKSNTLWSDGEFQNLLNFIFHPRFMRITNTILNSTHILCVLSNVLLSVKNPNFDHNLKQYIKYYNLILKNQIPWSLSNKLDPQLQLNAIPVRMYELLFCKNDKLSEIIQFVKSDKDRHLDIKELCQIVNQIMKQKFKDKDCLWLFEQGMSDLRWYSHSARSKTFYRELRCFVLSLLT